MARGTLGNDNTESALRQASHDAKRGESTLGNSGLVQIIAHMHRSYPLTTESIVNTLSDNEQRTLNMILLDVRNHPLEPNMTDEKLVRVLDMLVAEGKLEKKNLLVCKKCSGTRSVKNLTLRGTVCEDCKIIFGVDNPVQINDKLYRPLSTRHLASGGLTYLLTDKVAQSRKPLHEQDEHFAAAVIGHLRYRRANLLRTLDISSYLRDAKRKKGEEVPKYLHELEEESQAALADMEAAGILQSEPYAVCRNCNTASLSKRSFWLKEKDEHGRALEAFRVHCTRCKRIEDTRGLEVEGIFKEDPELVAYDGIGYKLTENTLERIKIQAELEKELESHNDEALLQNGSKDIHALRRAIKRRLKAEGEREHFAATSGSPSRFWGIAQEKGWISQEQFEAARARETNWNYAGD